MNENIDLNSDFNSSSVTSTSIDSAIRKLADTILEAREKSVLLAIKKSKTFEISNTTKSLIGIQNSLKRKWH